MSKENVKKFYEALKADKALAEELQNAVKVAKTADQAKSVLLQFAAKKDLAFTAEEAAEFESEARKLSEKELDQVNAAGGEIHNEGMILVEFCYINELMHL